MNAQLLDNSTQPLNIPYTILQLVIPGKHATIKTTKEWMIRHYNELIMTIMKVMDLHYITHCVDEQYWLIMIHGSEDTLIHIVSSKALTKQLLKQKDKLISIKTEVHCIQWLMPLPNRIQNHLTTNLIND